MSEIGVDGQLFTFDPGWEVEKFDEWPKYKALNGTPFHAKGCDLIAIADGVLHLIEVKDYSYASVTQVPRTLAQAVALKAFHTCAALFAIAKHSDGSHQVDFAHKASACTAVRVALNITAPRTRPPAPAPETVVANLAQSLRGAKNSGPISKLLQVKPLVRGLEPMGWATWRVRRDPSTRSEHL